MRVRGPEPVPVCAPGKRSAVSLVLPAPSRRALCHTLLRPPTTPTPLPAACCSLLFSATKRMPGRCAASQIGLASTASVLFRFTNGIIHRKKIHVSDAQNHHVAPGGVSWPPWVQSVDAQYERACSVRHHCASCALVPICRSGCAPITLSARLPLFALPNQKAGARFIGNAQVEPAERMIGPLSRRAGMPSRIDAAFRAKEPDSQHHTVKVLELLHSGKDGSDNMLLNHRQSSGPFPACVIAHLPENRASPRGNSDT